MLRFIIERLLTMIPILIVISIISFAIIQLPPGDYLTTYIIQLEASGDSVSQSEIEGLKQRYGLGQPMHVQYFKWISGVVVGDFGYSFEWNQPVNTLIWERLGLTLVVSISSLLLTWIVAFPIGVYSAVRQHSPGDYIATFVGFLGLSIPNFMLALILMYGGYRLFGMSIGGLFSPEFVDASWSWAKFVNMLSHLWIPMVVVGTAGTAGMIRIMRNNLLDELGKQYVVTARAKGLSTVKLIFKYPLRLALIPFVSTVGWLLPQLISGSAVVSVVLNLPTAGPLLLRALLGQDMYLAGSFTFLLATLTVIGTFISDLLLAAVDPRITYD